MSGGDSAPAGTKFDLTRGGAFFGGGPVDPKAVAGRVGGGVGTAGALGAVGDERDGDTVWARDGGGGGALAFAASAPPC